MPFQTHMNGLVRPVPGGAEPKNCSKVHRGPTNVSKTSKLSYLVSRRGVRTKNVVYLYSGLYLWPRNETSFQRQLV